MQFGVVTDQAYRSKHGANRVESIPHQWNGVHVQYNEWRPQGQKTWEDLSSDKINLSIVLGRHGGTCGPRLQLHQALPSDRHDPGFFFWIPANTAVWLYSEGAQLIRELQVRFNAEKLEAVLGDSLNGSRLEHPTGSIYDERVAKCASLLADTCIDNRQQDKLFCESLVTALLAATVQNINRQVDEKRVSGLAPWQLRIAKEYLQQHLIGDLSLADLASQTRLSQSRLARGFKASTGFPPYTWLLRQRVRTAQDLMARTNDPIATIATQVGFADQSHFTKAFRRATGSTPRAWRVHRHK